MSKNISSPQHTASWSAVFSMALCVTLLIASEFLPVSLLTPIARELHASAGQTGQAIAVSGFFAMVAALLTSTIIGKINRKYILLAMTVCMLLSLITIALSPNFTFLMISRAVLGICIGGFWSLATSVIMRLVSSDNVSRALGIMYMGQALAAAFAAPVGSYLESFIGWRGVFGLLVPLTFINLLWQLFSLPSLPSTHQLSIKTVLSLLKRSYFFKGMLCMALTFCGAFTMLTYLRPYLEQTMSLSVPQITFCFLILGCAGFIGGPFGSRMTQSHVLTLLKLVPMTMGCVTIGLLIGQGILFVVLILLAIWGAMNTALSIGWMGWMAQNVKDQPEAAGGLMVALIQGAILCGSTLGGETLTLSGITFTFICSACLSLLGLLLIGSGRKLLR